MILAIDERAAIDRYLHEHGSDWGDGSRGFSTLVAAVHDARKLAGRDLDSGKMRAEIQDDERGDFAAVLLYLVALEQIGRVLRPVGKRADRAIQNAHNDLMLSVRLWKPSIRSTHADALRMLRNALAHNFGLAALDERRASKGGAPPKGGWHHYLFALSDGGPLVALPKKRWNGQYGHDRRGGLTRVNHVAVGDLFEEVFSAITTAQKQNKLRLRVHPDETGLRFGFTEIERR